ncbi:MAG: hypothetical protein M3421_09480, partial [Bacteroidota bacterium]|nr:hypothetical protein [Bacteroidota bacterium]
EKNFNMIPYVNVYNTTPDAGYNQFLDLPRYSSGYSTLFHTLGFVPETHMLKPYKQRVEATYAFLESLLEVVAEEGNHIQQLRDQTKLNIKNQKEFVIDWELDKSSSKNINFKGFEGKLVKSELTGGKRLFYDRNKPFEKPIPFFNKYVPKTAIEKPKAYLIPKGWHKVIDRLKLNEVELQVLENDTIIEVESYFIEDYKTVEKPYEGHYLHFDTKVKKQLKRVPFIKGDYIIYTDQAANRYLVETLEPAAPDSFFNWNFFDTILQQKEGFSDYVFEDVALNIIEQDAELKKVFDDKKKSDSDFAGDPNTQLNFIYKLSPHYEEAHLLYPVYRLVEK